MNFKRLWSGRYKSDDGRFFIERWYDTLWILMDTYENQDENQKEYRKKTLSECKKLAEKIASDTKQSKHENLKKEESKKETTPAKRLADIAVNNTKYRKEWFAEVRSEIEKLTRFHSVEVPMVYGDGTETTDKMVSLEELGRILSEIEDAIGENRPI